jgi:hypothetical protein
MHSAGGDAQYVRGQVQGAALKINQQITALAQAIIEVEDAVRIMFELRTGDDTVLVAMGLLSNRVVPDMEATQAHLIQVRHVLEDYGMNV